MPNLERRPALSVRDTPARLDQARPTSPRLRPRCARRGRGRLRAARRPSRSAGWRRTISSRTVIVLSALSETTVPWRIFCVPARALGRRRALPGLALRALAAARRGGGGPSALRARRSARSAARSSGVRGGSASPACRERSRLRSCFGLRASSGLGSLGRGRRGGRPPLGGRLLRLGGGLPRRSGVLRQRRLLGLAGGLPAASASGVLRRSAWRPRCLSVRSSSSSIELQFLAQVDAALAGDRQQPGDLAARLARAARCSRARRSRGGSAG